nr:MAG: ORF1 [Torque teno midi virus]
MPFWWRRRRKPWFGRWRWRRRRNRYKTRRTTRRRRLPRRRNRRATRRRRRRRKVRRKKQQLPLRQWQPDSIVKCKIKGQGLMILGAECRQMRCYTDVKTETVRPKTPSGGGFGYEVYTLNYLYSEYKYHYNIWTKTNLYKELCRYCGVRIRFYRHQDIDFIIQYDRMPPYNITKFSYISCHPLQMLQHKHHKVILSKRSKPNGKLYKSIFIKPPKLMDNKWFIMDGFSKHPLCAIKAVASDFSYSYLQCCNENQQLGVYTLDPIFYMNGNWGDASKIYYPYSTIPKPSTFYIKYINGSKKTVTIQPSNYYDSIAWDKGYFQSDLLKAFKIYTNDKYETESQAAIPINMAIYNPNLDKGEGNQIWLSSIHNASYSPPSSDPTTLIQNIPLWLGLHGYFDYILKVKGSHDFLETHVVCIKSPAMKLYPQVGSGNIVIPIDKDFIDGLAFYSQPPTYTDKKKWYPTCLSQQRILNAIVETGPFIPKLANTTKSTWELKYDYCFYFKWGGQQVTDPDVLDPSKQNLPDSANTIQQTVEVHNPEKNKAESFIYQWDYRRGIIKETALKRMYDNLSTQTSIQAATEKEEPPQKKRKLPTLKTQEKKNKKIHHCLQQLFKENSSQESEVQTIHELIQQQQHKQQQLKENLLQLILDMRKKQQMLQLQTGLFY